MKCPCCGGNIPDSLISKHLASKGGKASKKGKRKDLEVGGKTWEKIHGKKENKNE